MLLFDCCNMVVTLPRLVFPCFKKLSFHVCDWHGAGFVLGFSNQGSLSCYSPGISPAATGNLQQDGSCCRSCQQIKAVVPFICLFLMLDADEKFPSIFQPRYKANQQRAGQPLRRGDAGGHRTRSQWEASLRVTQKAGKGVNRSPIYLRSGLSKHRFIGRWLLLY